jgi:hypothetical protein
MNTSSKPTAKSISATFHPFIVAMCFLLSGCVIGEIVKSELSAYDEPQSGDLAHIRLIGSRNVKIYPNNTCTVALSPGSGYPAGPQMGGQRKRDLGMPKSADMPKHYVEIAARAGQPIAAGFAFHAETTQPGIAGTGMPNQRSSSDCYASASFIPQAGQNYEMATSWRFGQGCVIQIWQLVVNNDGVVRRA